MPRAAVIYISKGGTTRQTAVRIASAFPGEAEVFTLPEFQMNQSVEEFDWLILGSPTYGLGELDFRWKKFLRELDYRILKKQKIQVALFVMGDARKHGKTFAGSLCDFHAAFEKSGVETRGKWPAEEYEFEHSRAVGDDGKFPGLVIDEINEAEKTESRISEWVSRLFQEVAS